jgi:hypothetical protein
MTEPYKPNEKFHQHSTIVSAIRATAEVSVTPVWEIPALLEDEPFSQDVDWGYASKSPKARADQKKKHDDLRQLILKANDEDDDDNGARQTERVRA